LSVNNILCQRLADLTAIPIYRPQNSEATARGTAYLLAGCPQVWPEGLNGVWFYPQNNAPLLKRFERWQKEMQCVLNSVSGKVK
jgi:glycerol kinase